MKSIKLTKNKFAIVDDDDYEKLNKYFWHFLNSGYAIGRVNDKKKKILMHRFILDAPSHLEVDHINGNKLDNRKENLRLCTRQQNEANKLVGRNNKTGFKGIVRHKNGFRAQTYFMKKNIHIGYFKTIEDAVSAYKAKVKELFGDFAKT